jgi:hypothetical protein
LNPFGGKERMETPEFRKWLDEKYRHHFSPEEFVGYNGRRIKPKYGNFLRIDFPRIPFSR